MNRWSNATTTVLLARWFLGGTYLYMGAVKVLHPADFLVAIRQYHLIESHLALNLIAVILPWLEILCGLLLLAGVAVRGTALVSLVMLVVFSFIVLQRARGLQHALAIPFCAVRFDCGCGGGEVLVCRKLLHNLFLVLLSIWVLVSNAGRWCAAYRLVKFRTAASAPPPPSS